MTAGSPTKYHHGDLPATLVRTAVAMVDADGAADLSIRAVARRAGVSSAAPYRHFPDRMSLLSAVGAVGYDDLLTELATLHPAPAGLDDLADLAVAYVRFALRRPGMFRVMFAEGCDRDNPDRVQAVEAIQAYLRAAVDSVISTDAPDALATGTWALVHGLAFLFLDGKLDPLGGGNDDRVGSDDAVESTVRAVVMATATARPKD